MRARYVVAADGSRSPVRQRLGIGMHGYGLLSHSATIYFRADCSKLLEGGNQGVIYVFNDRLRGFFRFDKAGTSGFLAVNTLGDPREPGALDVTADLTTDGARELVRAAIGVAGHRRGGRRRLALATPPPTSPTATAPAASSSPATRRT